MDKIKKQRVYQICNEIQAIGDAVKIIKNFNGVQQKMFEHFHAELNDLIKELKELKIGLLVKDVKYIRNLKTELWCGCSVEYQQDFIQNHQSYMY